MKKFFVVLALLSAMVLMVGCGSSSSSDNNSAANMGKLGKECYPNETCDKGLRCDTDNNVCIEDPENPINDSDRTDSDSDVEPDTGSDSDGSDSAPDNGDTTPDGGDTMPDSGDSQPDDTDTATDGGDTVPDNGDTADDSDNGDTAPDNGDSADDSDDSDTGTNPATNLPECSPTSTTPCIDAETDLIWSGKSLETMHWANAVDYCKDLNEGGFNDWRLPSRDVLRSLVQNCDTSSDCERTASKFGDIVFLWSSTGGSTNATGIYFFTGADQSKSVDESFNARCVRNLKCDEALFNPTLKKCVDPCGPEPCDSLTDITDATCVAFTYEQYSCGGKDTSSSLTWSTKAPNSMSWNDAVSYCDDLTESGYSDWGLPNISELRTLIQNCSQNEMPDGSCGVIDTGDPSTSCLSYSDCWTSETCGSCASDSTGGHSKFKETGWFWSSSLLSDDSSYAWFVSFDHGGVSGSIGSYNNVRCVR
ncbi:DUF1566 domain-containing protein [bacterium]|nr:DUF1566 domain-containing protein [bacterium]